MQRTTLSQSRRVNYARNARSRFDADERLLQPAVERALQTYLDRVRALFAARKPALTAAVHSEIRAKAANEAVFDDADADDLAAALDEAQAAWNPIMDAEIMPTYQRVLDKVLQHGLKDPRISTDLTKWRNNWLADRRQQLVGIPDQVSDSMRSELADLARDGGTSVDLARGAIDKMLNVGWQTWQGRAQLIARTETVGANNQGSLASWQLMSEATGTQAVKAWLATGDERTRQDHADVDGMAVGINDNFDVGGTPMNGPGDPAGGPEQVCNCRCTLTYEFPDGSQSDTPPADVAGPGDAEAPEDAQPDALTAAAGPQTGVAIMLGLGATSEQECAAPGVEVDPPGLHCVAYLAEPAASYSDEQKASLVAALAAVQLPIQAEAFATSHFNPNSDEREPCAVLLVQSDALSAVHDQVADVLATLMIDVSDAFPIWIPHVAIAYNADPSVIPPGAVGSEIEFNRLVLGWADEQIVVAGDGAADPARQTDPELVTAAVEAPVTAPPDAPPADTAPAEDAAPADAAPLEPQGPGWEGPIALLDVPSSDGRIISSGGGVIRPLPLPLSWQKESGENHDDSVVVGRVLSVEPRGNMLWGTGDWLDPMVCYDALQAMAQVDAGLGLVSVDLGLTEIGFADAEGNLIDPTIYEAPDDTCMVALGWEFGGVTIVSFPAFAEARISNIPDAEDDTGTDLVEGPIIMGDPGTFAGANPEAPTISSDGTSVNMPDGSTVQLGDNIAVTGPDGTQVTGKVSAIDMDAQTVSVTPPPAEDGTQPDDLVVPLDELEVSTPPPATDDSSLQAAAAVTPYTRALFAQRELDGPTPVTYDPATGAVYGHLGTWGQCHIGKLAETGNCVTVPEAPGGDYSYFHTTPMPMDDGELVAVGRLTIGTGHAGPRGGFRGAMEHYDNSGTQVALVRAYEDAYGVQIAGQVIHGTPPSKIEELLRAPISGDWRLVDPSPGQPLRLVAALGVNVPGFPVVPKLGMVGKRQVSLVAAGVVQLADEQPSVRLPSGATIAASDMEALVAAATRALGTHPDRIAVARDDEAAGTALRLARARMRARTMKLARR